LDFILNLALLFGCQIRGLNMGYSIFSPWAPRDKFGAPILANPDTHGLIIFLLSHHNFKWIKNDILLFGQISSFMVPLLLYS